MQENERMRQELNEQPAMDAPPQLSTVLQENKRMRQKLCEQLVRHELDMQPAQLPTWPTFAHILSTACVYAGTAVLFALLFLIWAVIHSFPVAILSFVFGVLAAVTFPWWRVSGRGHPVLFDRAWERFQRDHYARN